MPPFMVSSTRLLTHTYQVMVAQNACTSHNTSYIVGYVMNFQIWKYSPDWLGKQRFDIYIPKYNIAIEYNGEQHYKPITRFGGVLGYNKTVERDSYKLEKCKANNCKLYVLRYDYKNDDLQEIINTIQSLN